MLPACGGGGGSNPGPVAALGVGTTSLTFTAPAEGGANPADQTFIVTNSGPAGTTLNWSVTDDAPWLTVTPASGSLDGGTSQSITVSTAITGLLAGTQTAKITVAATGLASKTINAQLTIGQALTLNPAALNLTVTAGSNPADQTVTLANASNLSVPWTAASDQPWLTMNQTSGTLAANGQANLPVIKVTSMSLAAGSYTGTITITPGVAVTGVSIPVNLTVSAAASAAKNIFIGGTAGVGQLSSLVASASAGKAVAAAAPAILADAKVTITVIQADGSNRTTITKTSAQGGYSAEVVAQAGDTITVTIKKDGFTSLNKTVKVKADGQTKYVVSGNVAEATVQVAKAENGVFKAGGGTGPGFRFGLTRRASGALLPFAGSAGLHAAAAAGAAPELDISIPSSWAPGATAVTAQLAAFDPSIPSERQMFPGEFVGVGGGTAGAGKADSTEYQLESVSFFQSDVTPNNGEPLSPTVATGASKAAGDSTVIYKYIPLDGCNAVKKYADRDGDPVNGVQMPIYSYNSSSGKWVYIGEGTLKTYNFSSGLYETVAAATVSTGSDLGNLSCGTVEYYFEIVTNEWYTWWNLDYPLLFAQPEVVCISGTVVDGQGNPVQGAYIQADGYASGANTYSSTYAGTDGNFSIDLTLGNGRTVADFVFTAYDYSSWPATTTDFTSQIPATVSTTACNDVGNVVIVDSNTCSISGTILQENGDGSTSTAPGWTWVDLYTNDYTFYNWVYTDASGYFTSKSPCNKLVNVDTWKNSVDAVVDGIVSGPEKTDDGTNLVLADLVMVNNAPEAWTWLTPNPGKANQNIQLWVSAWDYEGDYPLTYAWTVKDGAGTTVTTSNLDVFNWTPTTDGTYSVQVVVADILGNETTVTDTLTVNPDVNSPPVIWNAYGQAPQTCGGQPALFVNAYDPDGDNLSYSFSAGAPTYDPSLGAWVPTVALTGSTVTVTVTDDGNPPRSSTTTIQVPQATGLILYSAEAWPTIQTVGAPVDLYAYAYDNSGSATYSWTIAGPETPTFVPYQQDGSYGYFTAQQPGDYLITLTVTGGACGDTITRTLNVTINPLTVAITNRYVQFRSFEDPTLNRFQGWVDLKDNGQLMDEWDFWGSSMYDTLGTAFPVTPTFWKASFLNATWNATNGSFGPASPGGFSGWSFNLSGYTLAAGDYTFETQLNGGALLNTSYTYPGQLVLPVVAASSMTYAWNTDGSLTLNWTEPVGTFDRYNVVLYDTNAYSGHNGELFYGAVPPGTSSVTLSASLIQSVYGNAGLSGLESLSWEIQTRSNDATNVNYARGYSNRVLINPPPASVDVIVR
ncbi:BACON domain-containing protein [Desulfuromonas sp. DDH964]